MEEDPRPAYPGEERCVMVCARCWTAPPHLRWMEQEIRGDMSQLPRACYHQETLQSVIGDQEAVRAVVAGCSLCFGFPDGPQHRRGYTRRAGVWTGRPDLDHFAPDTARCGRNVEGFLGQDHPQSSFQTWRRSHVTTSEGGNRPPRNTGDQPHRAHTEGGTVGRSQLFSAAWGPAQAIPEYRTGGGDRGGGRHGAGRGGGGRGAIRGGLPGGPAPAEQHA